jgi:hypothetical protein
MNTKKLTQTLLLALISILPVRSQVLSSLTAPEKKYIELIMTDTLSKAVSYLPVGYWFNIPDRKYGKLILLKSGPRNYFLREGTHHVYIPTVERSGIGLKRIDSTYFTGDNFRMMAFIRKDTLYQYGGYGFWQTRDFFIRFSEKSKEWELLTRGDPLPNEFNYHYYDSVTDKFYVLGSFSSFAHQGSPRKIYRDSAFAYDFRDRSWRSLGKIRNDFDEMGIKWKDQSNLCTTPFGLLDITTSNIKLYDIRNNLVYRTRDSVSDLINQIYNRDSLFNRDYKAAIYLGDSLHFIRGDQKRTERVSLRLCKQDFNLNDGQPVYDPLDRSSAWIPLNHRSGYALLAVILMSGFVFLLIPLGRNAADKFFRKTSSSPSDNTETKVITASLVPGSPPLPEPTKQDDFSFFLKELSPSEMTLLQAMVRLTMQGDMMDSNSMNKILGVSSKDPIVQKARRSMSITRINNTFTQTMKLNGKLIERERDSFDKRVFRYFISKEYLNIISAII